ncbi:MAG: ssDNA-binding protein [Methylocella sp.]
MAISENGIRLNNVRLAFPRIWTPEPFPGGKDPTEYFSANLILPKNHPQAKALDAIMVKLANAKWGVRGPAVLKAAKAIGKVFFRDGDAKADCDGFEGNMFVSARSKTRPTIFDGARNPLAEADGIVYAGCYVNATIECYAYTKGNNGLGAELKGIQFAGKGDAFGGGGKPSEADDFDEIAAPDDDEVDLAS